jgi:putative flippase GtrA
MKKRTIAAKYALFAAIATGVNIAAQQLTLLILQGPYSLYSAIASGTIAGVVVKYTLDKRFIFHYTTQSRRDNLLTFFLYGFMSGITTLVFWVFELAFHAIFEFPYAKYCGAVIGLTIGYSLKYFLDKRYVFIPGIR